MAQTKRDEMKELAKKIEEMEDVNTWQEEVTDLDRCIAWSEPLDLRAEVEQQTAAIEEQLPRDIEEVAPHTAVYVVMLGKKTASVFAFLMDSAHRCLCCLLCLEEG